MEPQIRYARTSDGVNIAYSITGAGPPLIHMSIGLSHLQLEWQFPEVRRWYERLSRNATLVCYDGRGLGLSDRDVEDTALEALPPATPSVRDLEGVVDHLAIDRFALFGQIHSGPTAVRYAAEHPERVSHLILWNTYARGSEWTRSPSVAAIRALLGQDWQLFTETMAHVTLGWEEGEPARRYAELMRAAVSPEFLARALPATSGWDVTPLLADVTAPTLVIGRRQAMHDASLATRLASGIPNARLVLFEGSSGVPYLGDWEAVAAEIETFLQDGGARPAPAAAPSGTAVILFTDIVDSTALTERLGDTVFRTAARTLDEGMRVAIRDAGGTAIDGKLLGDGVLATFPSAAQAIAAARRCIELSAESELRLHVGLHAGDVIREAGNVYGGAVNIASRICALSAPGEILVSDIVRGLARTSAGVTFDDRGEHEMKGVGEPLRVYAVRRPD